MGRMKDEFMKALEREFFKIPLDFDYTPKNTEVFKTVKNGIETVIEVKFNKGGYPITGFITSNKVLSEKEKKLEILEEELQRCVMNKDYHNAARISDEIKNLKST